ncbi:MAG: alpha/beta hydrolase [Acidimicrobiia bacterium]
MPGEFVRLPHATLYVHDFGGSGAPVVAVHGLGGAHLNWMPVAAGLSRYGHLLAPDLPGFGYSPPARNYRLSTHCRVLIDLLDHQDQPSLLIGNSLGGLVSMMVAAARPDLVASLILVAPATPPRLTDPTIDRAVAKRLLLQGVPFVGPDMIRRYWRSATPARQMADTLSIVCHHPDRVPKDVIVASLALATARRHQPWAVTALVGSGRSTGQHLAARTKLAATIARITAPTLIIKGGHDRVVAGSGLDWLISHRPEWEMAVMEDSGHCPQLEAPVEFLAVVDQWLQRRHATSGTG